MKRFVNTRDYRLLTLFTHGSRCARKNLINQGFSDELIDWHLLHRYIIEAGTNDIGDPVYVITQAGIDYRDS